MSCILDILSKEELLLRKENLLKQLKKVENEIKKRNDFSVDNGNYDLYVNHMKEKINPVCILNSDNNINSSLYIDKVINNEELDITSVELSDSSLLISKKSIIDMVSLNYQETNKKTSKIKLKKSNNLENSNVILQEKITTNSDNSCSNVELDETIVSNKPIIPIDHIKDQITYELISDQSNDLSKSNIILNNPKLKIKGTIKINIKKI